jgi:hypothetical protein
MSPERFVSERFVSERFVSEPTNVKTQCAQAAFRAGMGCLDDDPSANPSDRRRSRRRHHLERLSRFNNTDFVALPGDGFKYGDVDDGFPAVLLQLPSSSLPLLLLHLK